MKFIVDKNVSDRPNVLTIELNDDEATWLLSGLFTKIVLGCDSEDELRALVMTAEQANVAAYTIIDSGKTEFHNLPTLTCVAFGPAPAEKLDRITGHLRPL